MADVIFDKLQVIFKDVFEYDISENPKALKDDIALWDSITHLNLVLELEDGFGVQFLAEEVEQINGVEVVHAMLMQKLN